MPPLENTKKKSLIRDSGYVRYEVSVTAKIKEKILSQTLNHKPTIT